MGAVEKQYSDPLDGSEVSPSAVPATEVWGLDKFSGPWAIAREAKTWTPLLEGRRPQAPCPKALKWQQTACRARHCPRC